MMDGEGHAGSSSPSGFTWGMVGLLIVLGLGLRLWQLEEDSLFIDEGESCINALTILEHGYPTDHYLGLPLFENTLTEPWPQSEEYEFRDTSYSSDGIAIYHGWLPLYAIALSLWLHGIEPDLAESVPRVRHTEADVLVRIRAARLASVAFGGLFLLAIFLAGNALGGSVAGLSALTLASFAPKCIWIAQQARYYSASLALSTLALWGLWRLVHRPRRRDWVLAALWLGLLFHTSSLAFAILVLTSLVLVPRVLRQPGAWTGLVVGVSILLVMILPWMLWSGFLRDSGRIPMAREVLGFFDYFRYLQLRPGRTAAGLGAFLVVVLLWWRRAQLPQGLRTTLEPLWLPLALLGSWILVAYFGFQLMVPAASCSLARLTHNLVSAPLLLCALGLAVLAKLLSPRLAPALGLVGSLGVLLATGNFLHWQRRNPYEVEAVWQTVAELRKHPFRADTRIYSLPYQHFCLMYYTGLPVQSIAPVRRSFLDAYAGEILVLEVTNRVPAPDWRTVQEAAAARGKVLDEYGARVWTSRMLALMIRAEVTPLVRRLEPPAPAVPAWAEAAARDLLASPRMQGRFDYALDNPAMFADLPPMPLDEFWPVFFYRFVGHEQRIGANLNYAGRLAEAEARLLPSSWLILRIPPRPESRR